MKNKPSKILMVQPINFGFNTETAATNLFQKNDGKLTPVEIQKTALKEFKAFVKLLRANGIETEVVKDTANPITPDSIFPNNIVSFHLIKSITVPLPGKEDEPNETVTFENSKAMVLYSMMALNRRIERKGFLDKMKQEYNLVLDYSVNETNNFFLEGTGSIVFDYEKEVAYATLSPRTKIQLLEMLCKQLGYTYIAFNSVDKSGMKIYHTNVMLAIGNGFAVVCENSIKNKKESFTVMKSLIDTDHEIITIDYKQLNSFAGNIYQLFNNKGESFIVMSEQAFKSFKKAQIEKLSKFGKIIHTPLYTIEKYGGGSARCMIADIRY